MSVRITCAAQRNLCDFINLTIYIYIFKLAFLILHLFFFILHVPSLSSVGPYIFLSILLSAASVV